MIRSVYTNNQLKKVGKYKKFLMLRTYNLLIIAVLFSFTVFNAMKMVSETPIIALVYLLAILFVLYVIVVVHDRSFYGLFTPLKIYQENMINVLNNNKGRHGLISLVNTLFLSVLVYFVITEDIIIVAVFALVTLIVQMALVDIADLSKINKIAKKFEIDIDEYRIFDNSIFENLTKEQIFYVHCKREELVAFIALNKELTKEQLVEKFDREEYMLITMIARQMERLGK